MSLTVTQRPSTTISGETSRWNAIAHPLLYKMQRKDFTFASITNSGGFVRLVLDSSFGDVASSFDVDDVVYFQTDGGVYATTGNVTASTYSAPNTLVTLDTAYISSSTGWVNNETLRPNYGVDVIAFNAANVALNEAAFRFTPNSSGALEIDIRRIIRAYLSPDNDANLTGTTDYFDNTNAYLKFYIKYTEVWTASAESQTNDSSNQFFAVLGAMQIPSAYGSNMATYVSFDDGTPKADFLTKLDSPRMWRGYPFLLSAIVGDGVTGNQFLSDGTGTTTPAAINGKLIDFDLKNILNDLNADSASVTIYRDSAPDVELTNAITVTLHDACDNPVMLMARNSLGGCIQWMFDHSQDYDHDYGDGRKAKRLVMFAENLTVNEWEALQDFITLGTVYRNNITEFTSSTVKTSTRIGQQVYVLNSDGTKIGVTVMPTRNRTETQQVKHTFEIEIEYPETFVG